MRISDWSSDVCSSDLSFGNCGRILGDQRGAIAVITALALPVLLGFAALGVDVAGWYAQARAIQTAADAAALSEIGRASCRERVSVRVDLGGRRILNTNTNNSVRQDR